MKLFILRHGKADWPDWNGPDDERPLTDEGIKDVEKVAAVLKRLKVDPDVIFTSPLPRALQTASIVAKTFGVPLQQRTELEPGFDRRKCTALLATRSEDDIMLVGHEPDFTRLIRSLTGGRVKMPKAATAALEIGEDEPAPRLLWLFPAKTLIRLYA